MFPIRGAVVYTEIANVLIRSSVQLIIGPHAGSPAAIHSSPRRPFAARQVATTLAGRNGRVVVNKSDVVSLFIYLAVGSSMARCAKFTLDLRAVVDWCLVMPIAIFGDDLPFFYAAAAGARVTGQLRPCRLPIFFGSPSVFTRASASLQHQPKCAVLTTTGPRARDMVAQAGTGLRNKVASRLQVSSTEGLSSSSRCAYMYVYLS